MELIWRKVSLAPYPVLLTTMTRHPGKVIPCGTATCLWMESSWSISYLYDLWRANAVEGNT